ncbi:unnamed protein product [Prorocentrum cordatum]|uniref:Uncharacterized protein n=1 Tax=Prorocentrum cordatum TaxID=2364126 RepID=A0ABN9PPD6_9DINO|nr:unnamed protein product [Polarella glacialis]
MASPRLRRLLASVALAVLSSSQWRAPPRGFVPAPPRAPSRRGALAHGLLLGPAALAAGAPPASAGYVRWVGEYEDGTDPGHPGCERTIEKNGADYLISGTSSSQRGQKICSKTNEVKRWYMDGKVESNVLGVGNTMAVDLPSKSGSKLAKLTFDPSLGNQGGLIFPDGTVWEKSGPLVRKTQSRDMGFEEAW